MDQGALSSEFLAGCGADVVRLWGAEPPGGLGSVGWWFLVLQCSQGSDSPCSESLELFQSVISEEILGFQGFPVENKCLLPAGKLQLILHSCLSLLDPGASRRTRSFGVRTHFCQRWWYLDK